uniref:Ribosomal RNA methyltransferase FtsJ domain-containing protein n=1 Tax=Noctiluca scintillans TaxID=2966 RepID=A0A7S1B063_NOCSC
MVQTYEDSRVKTINAEHETEVHFQKCYGVMAELFEAHDNFETSLNMGFKFLDLGCAPGGFSTFLLNDPRCLAGFGVSLPSTSGGFPVRVRSDSFFLQQGDLFEIGPDDLLASNVHMCICDVQYMRNNVAWDEKYRGVRCRSKQHGVWALLCKQFWLGLSKLLAGGTLIFRFGWRDPGPDDEATIWYKKCSLRLFSLFHDLFESVREVKSDYFNAVQSSFYVCCSNFNQRKFVERQVAKLFGVTFNHLVTTETQDATQLDILKQADKIRTPEVDQKISDMLDRVHKLRMIHLESRKRHQQREAFCEDPRAVLFIAPLPSWSNEELMGVLSLYGRVRGIDRSDRHTSVKFACVEHAQAAVAALRRNSLLGEGIAVWTPGGEDELPWEPGQSEHVR